MSNPLLSKKKIRETFLKKRRSLTPEEMSNKSRDFTENFFKFLKSQKKEVKTIALYASFNKEILTDAIFDKLIQQKISVVYPRISQNKKDLNFFNVTHRDQLQKGSYSILEPGVDLPRVEPKQIDLFVVPAIVFDNQGYRIGYGRGFYDRLLSSVDRSSALGVAYEFQVIDLVPHDHHDRPVSAIITEQGIREV